MDVHLADLVAVSMSAGKDQYIPLQATDDDGHPISYTAATNNANVTATVLDGGRSLRLHVSGVDGSNAPFSGVLEFRLFEDQAPLATQRIIDLVTQDFYDNLIFHRVINNFVAQGGDPLGTGAGGSPLPDFRDEFNVGSTFTSRGLLAMANSGDDTNDSQFFVVDTDINLSQMPEHLNFNHTIFGVLTKGQDILAKIMSTSTTGNNGNPANKPLTDVVIADAEIFTDTTNGVLRVHTTEAFNGTVQVSVTANNGQGSTETKTTNISVATDSINDRPFLGPVNNLTTNEDTPITFTVQGIDLEKDTLNFVVRDAGNFNNAPANVTVNVTTAAATGSTPATATITLTPAANFHGTLNLLIGVRDQTLRDGSSSLDARTNFDTQAFTLTVTSVNDPPTSAPQTLQTALNTPINITLAGNDGDVNETQTLTFEIVDQPSSGNISNFDASTGTLTYTPANNFSGQVTFTYRVKDNGGGADTSPTATITINVDAPAAPTNLDLVAGSDDGFFNDDNFTSVLRPTITVQAAAGVTVKVFVNNGQTGYTATETSPGRYTVTLPEGTLPVGTNQITAVATRNGAASTASTPLEITFAPKLNGLYVVPGDIGVPQVLNSFFVGRMSQFRNEIGYVVVDDASGKIGNLKPGDRGWAEAALSHSTRKTLVARNDAASAEESIEANGGQFLVFYIISNGSTQDFLNGGNRGPNGVNAFFSLQAANADRTRHALMVGDRTTGDVVIGFEDMFGGGDTDFNDAVITITNSLNPGGQIGEYLMAPAGDGKTLKMQVRLTATNGGAPMFSPGPNALAGEFGVFVVDDEVGRAGGLFPGNDGYLAAALNSPTKQVLFVNGDAVGTLKSVNVPGGARLAFYYIPGGTSATVLASNPNNTSNLTPRVFMTFDSGNPDDREHFRWFAPEGVETDIRTDGDHFHLHLMDTLNGTGANFDKYRVDISFST